MTPSNGATSVDEPIGRPVAAFSARRASWIADASATARWRLFESATSITRTSLLRRMPTSSRARPSFSARSCTSDGRAR